MGCSQLPALKQAIWVLISWLPENAKKGYVNASGDGLASGHLAMLGFLFEVAIVYGCGFFLLNPYQKLQRQVTNKKQVKLEIPALFYLLLIALILVLIFGGLAFALDYYRIPVVTIFLIISILSYWRFNVNHYYQLHEEKQEEKQPVKQISFQQALASRLQRQTSDEKTLVVVCASGGGIQAAGWTVQVLTGLQQLLGDEFTDAIGLISSVSGGSVGTMFYLDGLSYLNNLSRDSNNTKHPQHQKFKQEPEQKRKEELDEIFERATQDSLDATGWGLAYPDLWRMIGLPFLAPEMQDRGTAIEADWKAQMRSPYTSLATWRREIERGEIPIPVFNATIVEDGSRFSICPLKIEKCFRDGCDRKYKDFKTEYPNHDIDATTAARLSATFPYVSPVCRNQPQPNTPVYHIADGGFFDNFGVYTALEWLEKCVLPHSEQLNIKKVLLLEIDAFPAPVADTTKTGDRSNNRSNLKGWWMTALGPLIALLNVRSSTQATRNAIDVIDFQERWNYKSNKQLEIERCKIQFPDLKQIKAHMQQVKKNGSRTPFTNREGNYAPPLSWKLTELEKEAIRQAWQCLVDKHKSAPEIAELKALWSRWHLN